MTETQSLWEILVPTQFNNGKPIRTRYHRVWDKKVYNITGGLTILRPAIGTWISPDTNMLYKERMIPVRISCTKEQLYKILSITKEYYKQEAIFAYRISDEVIVY